MEVVGGYNYFALTCSADLVRCISEVQKPIELLATVLEHAFWHEAQQLKEDSNLETYSS